MYKKLNYSNLYRKVDLEKFLYLKNGNEGVTSIQGGSIGTSGFDEIVVSTYNG